MFSLTSPLEHYWKEFYKTPEERTPSRLDTQINNLLIQAGQPPRPQRSTYQEYVNRWQDFLTAIGGGVNSTDGSGPIAAVLPVGVHRGVVDALEHGTVHRGKGPLGFSG